MASVISIIMALWEDILSIGCFILDISVISGGCILLGSALDGILNIIFASFHIPSAIINLINTVGYTLGDIVNCIGK